MGKYKVYSKIKYKDGTVTRKFLYKTVEAKNATEAKAKASKANATWNRAVGKKNDAHAYVVEVKLSKKKRATPKRRATGFMGMRL